MSLNLVNSSTGALSPVAGSKQIVKYIDITQSTTGSATNNWQVLGVSGITEANYPHVINIQSLTLNVYVSEQIIGNYYGEQGWFVKVKTNTEEAVANDTSITYRVYYIE